MLSQQRALNRQTRELWDSMARHRNRVTRELLRLSPRKAVCIFGAGNCNDLDLAQLRARFEEVHLVDLDDEALAFGIERQGLVNDAAIHCHRGVDVTDPRATAGVPRCDVIVSCCILSQLIDTLAKRLGTTHPQLKELVLVLREAHLEMMFEKATVGGALLVISDMVSSDTAPALSTCPDLALLKLRDELIAAGNYFYGTNPLLIERALVMHTPKPARVERRPPWRWRLGERAFLVTAVRADLASGV